MAQSEGLMATVTNAEQARWAAAALQQGLDLEDWVRRTCDAAAETAVVPASASGPAIPARRFKGRRTIPKRRERKQLCAALFPTGSARLPRVQEAFRLGLISLGSGRPYTPRGGIVMPRSERLELRLTDAEKAVWDAAAVQAGVPLSEYIRARVNEGIAAATERSAVPAAPASAPTEQAARLATAPPPPVFAPHPLAALFPIWRNGLCPDCTLRGTPAAAVAGPATDSPSEIRLTLERASVCRSSARWARRHATVGRWGRLRRRS